MILLQGNNIARTLGADVLFEKISFKLQERSRTALVGRNGAGKSTLLKIIAGVEEPSAGTLTKTKELKLNYLAQDTGLNSNRTIYAEMLTVFKAFQEQEQQLRELEAQMAESGEGLESLMNRYDSLSESFRSQGGYSYEAEIKSVLNGFSFPEEMWEQEIASLSGGQKTRLALAKMLLEKPQLLILDEPTNHLDIATLSWLENYLKNYDGSLLIVSHDRYFLDQVTNETLELSRGALRRFSGNYSQYIEQSEQLLEQENKAFEKQAKEISKLEDFVQKNISRASTTKRAQSRRKQLEKMERLERPGGHEAAANISFRSEQPSGNVVLTVSEAAIGYECILSEPINIDERKGQSIAIVGPNGIGKSTLIKSIIGQIPFLAGSAKLGANVSLGYYDQDQSRLTASNTVLDELWNDHRLLNEVEIRNVLGSFLFSGEDVKKTVGMLSGGEKARLLLAKLAMEHDNFLLLDEPTNHLDIDSREVLENALIDYDGTILFVSHDRYFINRVASEVLEITESGSRLYLGDYDYYLEKKAEENQQVEAELEIEKQSQQKDYANQKDLQRNQRKLEREEARLSDLLDSLDEKIQNINEAMAENAADFVKLGELQAKIDQLEAEKEETETALLEIMEQI